MPLDRMFDRYRTVLSGSTLLMVALSWPLWVDRDDFPRVPFFRGIPQGPAWISWIVLVALLASLALATIGWNWRRFIGVSLVLFVFAVIEDQNRFQPWVYQFGVVAVGLIATSRRRALMQARWYTITLYAYSGLSKLDISFCQDLGPTFLSAALSPFGLSAENWPSGLRNLAVLAMPGVEILIAALLGFRTTRRAAVWGSLLLHATLIFLLGPWSLGHSTIVLVWNLAQSLENVCLFLPRDLPNDDEADSKIGPLARLCFWVAMILPLGERWGFCDAWPAHALYASHAERSEISIHEDEVERFPEAIRKRLGPPDATPWRRLDLTGWSRDIRGTPLYPSGRIGNAVAEFLEVHDSKEQPIRLVQWGRASLWEGRRERDESIGLKSIRLRGDRFWLNAHPSP